MKKNTEYWAKSMKVIYVAVFILALFVISDGKEKIQLLERNPVVIEFNSSDNKNYKIVRVNDVTSSIEAERGLISQEYLVRVNEEATKEEYIKISNKIINSIKSNYSDTGIGNITINFIMKKGDILLHNVIYSPKN